MGIVPLGTEGDAAKAASEVKISARMLNGLNTTFDLLIRHALKNKDVCRQSCQMLLDSIEKLTPRALEHEPAVSKLWGVCMCVCVQVQYGKADLTTYMS